MSFEHSFEELLLKIPIQYQHGGIRDLLETFNNPHSKKEELLWTYVENSGHESSAITRHASYIVWQRWLDETEQLLPSQHLLIQPGYWRRLLDGLQRNDRFERKFSLHLLLRSVELLSSDVYIESDDIGFHFKHNAKLDYIKQYREFCNLFEILAFNGYINQVKEALSVFPDISILKNPVTGRIEEKSLVTGHFWTALLEAALETKNDALCDCLGSWLLKSPYTIQTSSHCHAFFITQAFLPWAATGRLFTASILRRGSEVSCSHGDRLSTFCSKLISDSPNNETKSFYIEKLLRSIGPQQLGNRPAIAYALQGIAAHVASIEWNPTGQIIDCLLALLRAPEFSAVQRLCIVAHCRVIAKDNPDTLELAVQERDLEQRLFEPEKPRSVLRSYPDVESIEQALGDRNYKGLPKNRLNLFCGFILRILQEHSASDNAKVWLSVLGTIWEQSEIQEHPRDVVVLLPKIMLNPRILNLAISNPELQTFLSPVILELYALADSRLYFWNTFAEKLLEATIVVEKAIRFLSLVEIFHSFVNRPPRPSSEYLVDLAMLNTVTDESGQRRYSIPADEEYGIACMFSILNCLQKENRSFSRRLLDHLLSPWLEQLQSSKSVPMISKWKRTSQLQAVIMLLKSAVEQDSKEEMEDYRDKLLQVVSVEPLPRFRFLLEWAIIALCLRLKKFQGVMSPSHILDLLSTGDQSKPKYIASLVKIATFLCLDTDSDEAFGRSLLIRLNVLSASSRVAIRHEAQWHFPILWKQALDKRWSSITENPIFLEFFKFIESHEKYQEPPRDRILTAFEPAHPRDLQTLFQGGYLKVDPPENPLCTVNEFEAVMKKVALNVSTHMPIGLRTENECKMPLQMQDHTHQNQLEELETSSSSEYQAFTTLQTKGHSLSFRVGTLESSKQPEATSQLIVVASLIENPHNLGGLCRVSEIFGVREMHLPSLEVTKDKRFQSVSVSSELHILLIKTPSTALGQMLKQKKEQGFSLVGIEQTSSSVVLPAVNNALEKNRPLSRKCVLILGAERTGIPASILGMVDHCVEIRQWGVIRSLNVQTAAAVVCYEWRRILEESERQSVDRSGIITKIS